MTHIAVTGVSGFVGQNLCNYLESDFQLQAISRQQLQQISTKHLENASAVIHLAGKAHDLKNAANSDEYYQVNTDFTKQLFDAFLLSDAKTFIIISSVKAAADSVVGILTEDFKANPQTHYGKSKRLAEEHILNTALPQDKSFYILRPCMIHGPGNKGNLNLLYKFGAKGFPWLLSSFNNQRSFCSIQNLCFVIKELLSNTNIPSGIYNIADDEALATNEVISLIAQSQNKTPKILHIAKPLILFMAKLGDVFRLPLTTERLQKLTESYVVSNQKIKSAIGKDFPVSAKDGLIKTFKSFNNIK